MKVHVVTVQDYNYFNVIAVFDDQHQHLAQELADALEGGQCLPFPTEDNLDPYRITKVHMDITGPPQRVDLAMSQYTPYPLSGYEHFLHPQIMLYTVQGHHPERAASHATAARDLVVERGLWPEPGDTRITTHPDIYRLINIEQAHLPPHEREENIRQSYPKE